MEMIAEHAGYAATDRFSITGSDISCPRGCAIFLTRRWRSGSAGFYRRVFSGNHLRHPLRLVGYALHAF
jgi:hypothetical protein